MTDLLPHKDKVKIKRLMIKVLPVAAFVVILGLLAHWAKQSSPNQDDGKLKELQRLSSEMPVPSGLIETGTNVSSRGMDAGVYKYYLSRTGYEEVKKFYVEHLTGRGWALIREEDHESILIDTDGKGLEFQKGDMFITIEYAGSKTSMDGWSYAVSYVWRNG